MALDPKKRQKKLERRAAKRRSKHQLAVQEKSGGLAQRMAAAAAYPVVDCGVTEDLWTEGIGWALLSRQLPGGAIAVAVFLIDRYCLGVKNAIAAVTGRFTYESNYRGKLCRKLREMSPAAVRKLLEGAVTYARGFGLSPHADYHKAFPIFGDVAASACAEEFEFGKDGKPFFIAGPNDGPERCRRIVQMLERSCGPGGSHFLIPMDPNDGALRDALVRKRAELEEAGEGPAEDAPNEDAPDEP